MASKLNDTRKKPGLIISSPAVRAISTALIFSRKFQYDPKKIILEVRLYETGFNEYMDVINKVSDTFDSIMLFGHNSTITNLVNTLTDPFTENVPTCGVTAISFNVSSWREVIKNSGKLVLYDFPKKSQH
jgi:phosphohistidine phosphatase